MSMEDVVKFGEVLEEIVGELREPGESKQQAIDRITGKDKAAVSKSVAATGLSCSTVKKNCYNCKHLDVYTESDSDGYIIGEGWMCEKQYQKAEERGTDIQHERNMERKEYLGKGKVCFEPKAR